jgi:O-antigen ligase
MVALFSPKIAVMFCGSFVFAPIRNVEATLKDLIWVCISIFYFPFVYGINNLKLM